MYRPGHDYVGTVSLKHIYEIAKAKQTDNPAVSVKSWCRSIMGSALAAGIKVEK
jgi:large subunit ribosomal protein L11